MPSHSTADVSASFPLCVLALGGNLGTVPVVFQRAVEALKHGGFRVRSVSAFRPSEPVGMPPGTPAFLNAALSGFWDSTPEALLALCRGIEADCGRPNDHARNTSRTLDIDIILFGDRRIDTPDLIVPHPRAHERDFVLHPLREIEPDLAERFFPSERGMFS